MHSISGGIGGHGKHALETGGDGAPHLLGSRCADCQTLVFPPVELCPECMSENVARQRLGDVRH